jgi:DNA-binding transcriptional regulator YhcF (GntR family)
MDIPGLGTLDPASDRPVYKQIADHLREAIQAGRLGPGDALPSEADMIAHYHVARMTVRQAAQLLKAEELITAEQGRGLYVQARPDRLPADVRELLTELSGGLTVAEAAGYAAGGGFGSPDDYQLAQITLKAARLLEKYGREG